MRLTSIDSAFRELERQPDRLTQPAFGGAWASMPMDAVRRQDEPEHLDADGVQAAYDNGVLTVRVPVPETAAQPRKIEIAKGDAAGALSK
ncbi:Hsp20 family protein [Nonomuraea sp. B5E05]|uniref:Hsp20/alpha crystallin family protein n=1 Tax=Nonomuraea sp. B5E05 TaxID=3153569 RepID=UPI0032614A8E